MKVYLYRGKSLVSKAIQFQTRSPYSHVAFQFAEYEIYEAWHIGGVRKLRYATEGHSPGTAIDVCRVHLPPDFSVDKAREFAEEQVGKGYDFKSVWRFLSRRSVALDDRWFCSEYLLATCEAGGAELLRILPSMATPRDVDISPLLSYEFTIGD